MHSKSLSRILIAVSISVAIIFTLALSLVTDNHFSDDAWKQIVERIGIGDYVDNDLIHLQVDYYDDPSNDIRIKFTGTASSSVGNVTVTLFRCTDIGEQIVMDEAGELGALSSQYLAEMEGSRFTTPDVHLQNGNNFFLVMAMDTAGNQARQLLSVRYFLGYVEDLNVSDIETTEDNIKYLSNLITITFKPNTTMEKARSIIEEIGGTEVGNIALTRRFQVKVPKMEYADLVDFSNRTAGAYDEILNVEPEYVMETSPYSTGESPVEESLIGITQPPNDPWSSNGRRAPDFDWDEALPSGVNWNLEAIQAMSAWEYKPFFRDFTVGVIDIGFTQGHDDILIRYANDIRVEDAHGTHIAGTIGATINNGVGISGVMNKGHVLAYTLNTEPIPGSPSSFYYTQSEMLYALVSCITNGASVVNVSLGATYFDDISALNARILSEGLDYLTVMAALLSEGYDFVIIQAAGNGDTNQQAIDSRYSLSYNAVRALGSIPSNDVVNSVLQTYGYGLDDFIDRVIVVGNAENETSSTPLFKLDRSSNCGDFVDIAAPGTDIFSTVPGGFLRFGGYDYMSGTSMAAPHVAAVAAMAWSTNPRIRGSVIKKILTENYLYIATAHHDSTMPGYQYPLVNAKLAIEAALAWTPTYIDITLKDAANAHLIGGSITLYKGVEPGGPLFDQYTVDSTGFIHIALDSGDYIADVSSEGYISTSLGILAIEGITASYTISLSRPLPPDAFRIILTWGELPPDLDSHLSGKDVNGVPIHVKWNSDKHFVDAEVYAMLDVDERHSYGPETITIYGLPKFPLLYSVHDYTNQDNNGSLAMSQSGARVEVLRGTESIKNYTVPVNRAGVVWNIFEITTEGEIRDIGTFEQGPLNTSDVGDGYR